MADRTNLPPTLIPFLQNFKEGDSVVYVVCRHGTAQYVGENAGFPVRFNAGFEIGYRWPQAQGAHTVNAWRLAGHDTLRKAAETEVALRVRLVTGHWPIELGRVEPFYFALSSRMVQISLAAASQIVLWLMNQKHLNPTSDEVALFKAFTDAEIDLMRYPNVRSI